MTAWAAVRLGDLCEILIGRTPPRAEPRYWGPGHAWLSIADMNQGRDLVTTKETITEAAVRERNCRPVPAGTLVFSFKLSVGKVGFVRSDMFTNEAIAALPIRDHERIDATYLFHALSSLDLRGIGERAVKGITLNIDSVANLRVPLPPLAEQRRIAEVLDKADAVRRKRRESLRLLDEFLRSAFLEMFGDPVSNENGWEVRRLEDVASIERGKFSPRPRNDPRYYEGPHPFIQTGDIAGSGGRLREWTQTLNEEGTSVSRQFPKGTIATAIAANIGDTAIVDFDFYCPDSVVGIAPRNDAATPEFLETCLRFLKPGLTARAPMTAQRNINLQVLKPLRIPVPPLPLQVRFQAMRRRVEALSVRIEAASGDFDALFDSLAQQAFGGTSAK